MSILSARTIGITRNVQASIWAGDGQAFLLECFREHRPVRALEAIPIPTAIVAKSFWRGLERS